jgi:uncharacterized SAM-binding protein YcdF (DUF218 family)
LRVSVVTEDLLEWARVIWEFHQLRQTPVPGDTIIALGTNDLRVAEFAADLYHRGFGKLLVCTGGIAHHGDLLQTPWDRTEAEMYANVAEQHGVPRESILIEPKATNTAENIGFSRNLLMASGKEPSRIVLAVKPFMQRRTWATLAVQWPGIPATITSPAMTLDEYFTAELTPEKIIHIMMGDLQRLWIYGGRNWSAVQEFPADVLDAYQRLKAAGFTQHLIEEDE